MTSAEIIESLEDQAKDKEAFIDIDDPGDIFAQDVAALRAAAKLLREASLPNDDICYDSTPMTHDEKRRKLLETLGEEEVLLQLAEESAELAQAALKVRRAKHGLTPVSLPQAYTALAEETADVSVCVKMLADAQVLDSADVSLTAKNKLQRWYQRVCET